MAPSLIPKGGSDKVKTDKRDSRRLVRLGRAGELTPVRVPSPAEEAVRAEGCGALRPVVVKRDGEVPPLQCLLASGVVGDDVVGQVLEVPVMRLLARGGEHRGKLAQLAVQFRQQTTAPRARA